MKLPVPGYRIVTKVASSMPYPPSSLSWQCEHMFCRATRAVQHLLDVAAPCPGCRLISVKCMSNAGVALGRPALTGDTCLKRALQKMLVPSGLHPHCSASKHGFCQELPSYPCFASSMARIYATIN